MGVANLGSSRLSFAIKERPHDKTLCPNNWAEGFL